MGGRSAGQLVAPRGSWTGRDLPAPSGSAPYRRRVAATLVARGLAAGHGERSLFSGLDLVVGPGDVIGLVGANGAGKSTLLRMLAGLEAPLEGSITLSPPTATVGYLPQEPDRRAGETVLAFLGRRTGVAAASAALDAATTALADGAAGSEDAYADALERWLGLGGADFEERAAAVTAQLGLGVDLGATLPTLSGGEASRAQLASLLLSRYDLSALDEPTNDLDLDGLAQLEEFVVGLRSPVVLVSHDREFLARTVNRVVELDLAQQQVGVYDGGYDSYLAERETARRHAREAFEEYADKRSGLQARIREQRSWSEQGVKALKKRPKDHDTAQRDFKINRTEKQASKVRQSEKLLERMETVDEPRREWELQLVIAAAPRSGSVVATLSGAVVRRGSFTLGPVDLQIDWADRVVVTGPNGGGKSTLLGALLGRLPLAAGRQALGAGVVVGEVDQARALFTGDAVLADTFGRLLPDLADADVRTLLAKFGLRSAHVLRVVSTLSPGERTRAALALLQARGVNLLVLDEPTNHLDLPAIEQLEAALEEYPGTVLLVTHDRRLLASMTRTRSVHVEAGTVSQH